MRPTVSMSRFILEYDKANVPAEPDGRLHAPAFERNHAPIWSALEGFLRRREGNVLELGSGTGQHIAAFARAAPQLTWWPSDLFPAHLASIEAWRREAGLPNLRAPQRIDLVDAGWGWQGDAAANAALTAMICINVLHIAPWQVSLNLVAGAARFLREDGRLFVYGPFMRDGVHTAPSNKAFDLSLRAENPDWGVRDTAALGVHANAAGLGLAEIVPMPANNLVLVFARAQGRN